MTETIPKRCRWLIRPHRWTRWQTTEGISYRANGLQVPIDIQERHCVRCGRAQRARVTSR